MYVFYSHLADANINTLTQLASEVEMVEARGRERRVGSNGGISRYRNSRSFTWKHKQRELFKAQFPEKVIERMHVGSFLEITPAVGFLDRMTKWVDKPDAGVAVAYALNDDLTIYINDVEVLVAKGSGIGFSLSQVHEIKPTPTGQLWAIALVRGTPEQFV